MKALVTGCAGFIGMHTARRLLERGNEVVGLDNLKDHGDASLKHDRLEQLKAFDGFRFEKLDIADRAALQSWWDRERPQRVVHLAAQSGVRRSLIHPSVYIDANLVGFGNMLEGCRRQGVEHLVYASSSSVYGGNARLPFSEHDSVDHPISLYAATKKANELMAHAYSHLYRLPVTGLRFFTVYGPWGRPDMALSLFARAMLAGEAIDVFNGGQMVRDFTYIDDIVEGVVAVLDKPAQPDAAFDASRPDPATSAAPYRLFNIGNHQPTPLMDYVSALSMSPRPPAQPLVTAWQLGQLLKAARKRRKLTQAEVAGRLGLSQNRVSYLEQHPDELSFKQLLSWCTAVGRSCGWASARASNRPAARSGEDGAALALSIPHALG